MPDQVKQRIRETVNGAGVLAEIAGVIGIIYAGAVLAVNTAAMPLILGYNGLERAVGGKETNIIATLIEKKAYRSPNIEVSYGKFRTGDGREVILYDSCDFPSYKFLPNCQIQKAEIGRKYDITSLEGPISHKMLHMKQVN